MLIGGRIRRLSLFTGLWWSSFGGYGIYRLMDLGSWNLFGLNDKFLCQQKLPESVGGSSILISYTWLFEYILARQSFVVMSRKSPCNLIAKCRSFSTPPFFGIHVSLLRCRYGQDHLFTSCCIDTLNIDEYCWQRFLCWVRLTVFR